MRFSTLIAAACGVAIVSAHGVVTEIQGTNGVNMRGLSTIVETPRDCASPNCGAEADTSIIRKKELGTGKASALGRTEGGGPVDAATVVSSFLGKAAANKRAFKGFGAAKKGKGRGKAAALGAGAGAGAGAAAAAGGAAGDAVGTKSAKGDVQLDDAGVGASSGLPTCSDDGVVSMTYHQVNQDGAGPLTAEVDATSGGTDPTAFVPATMIADVPGKILGLSATTTTDFAISAQLPAGTVCSGTVGGATNVCIMRLNNGALAGPFGGSVAFTQSAKAAKRAVEFNLARRHFARGIVERAELPPAEIQDDEDTEAAE